MTKFEPLPRGFSFYNQAANCAATVDCSRIQYGTTVASLGPHLCEHCGKPDAACWPATHWCEGSARAEIESKTAKAIEWLSGLGYEITKPQEVFLAPAMNNE